MATEQQLRDALESCKEIIAEQQEQLVQLTTPPLSIGIVKEQTENEGVFVVTEKSTAICEKVPGVDLKIGDVVSLNGGGQIVKLLKEAPITGQVNVVREVKDGRAEIETGAGLTTVTFNEDLEISKNDRVVLDGSGQVIVKNLGKDHSRFKLAKKSEITWDDIGGQTEAKQALIEAIELPMKHPDIYEFYGKRPTKGLLLYGPPGNGKTLLGKAAATAIQNIFEKEDGNAFMYVKGPEILSKWVGETEQTIRAMFARCRAYFEEFGHPCVLFIDEADSILQTRGSGRSSDVEKTIVPMFLSEMDGLDESGAFVMLATNRPDAIDPAVLREGRIDRKVKVRRPDAETARDIFMVHLKEVPLASKQTVAAMATHGVSELYSDKHALYDILMKNNAGIKKFTLGHIASGAMIEGVVEQACSVALHRDIESGEKPSGVTVEDISQAVTNLAFTNRELELKDEVKEYVAPFKSSVQSVAKAVPEV